MLTDVVADAVTADVDVVSEITVVSGYYLLLICCGGCGNGFGHGGDCGCGGGNDNCLWIILLLICCGGCGNGFGCC